MTIELFKIKYSGGDSYAAINHESGEMNIPFTQFLSWLVLNKSTRIDSHTRGDRPTFASLRQYAYALKNWFDWIDDWNEIVIESNRPDDVIAWNTAKSEHLVQGYIKTLKKRDAKPGTRNFYRMVIKMFYEDFCGYMQLNHLMSGLSEINPYGASNSALESDRLLGNYGNKKSTSKRVAVKEKEQEQLTFEVTNFNDISTLVENFDDPVYGYIAFFISCTGLRIEPVQDLPYPGSEPKINPYLTDPETIKNDYGIEDYFELKYMYKGHKEIGDQYTVDIPLNTWERIWTGYKPMLDERVKKWRKNGKKEHNRNNPEYQGRFPKYFWLTEGGRLVKAHDIQKAFRDSCNKIRADGNMGFPTINPRHLRNTYACAMVKTYADINGIPLDLADKSSLESIHSYVQEQLGHKNRKTTMKYIRTINKVIRRRWLPHVTPTMLPDGRIVGHHISNKDVDVITKSIKFGDTLIVS